MIRTSRTACQQTAQAAKPPQRARENPVDNDALDNVFIRSIESHLERFVALDPSILEDGLRLVQSQRKKSSGRIIDLECEDKEGRPVVVEFEKGETPDKAVTNYFPTWKNSLGNTENRHAEYWCERENVKVSDALRQVPDKVKVMYWD